MPFLLSLFLLGCQSVIQTNPCELYEREIESCFDEADQYLGEENETASYTIDLQCPPEEELTDAEAVYYSCLDEVWSSADCSTTEGLIDLAVLASGC